MELSLNVFIENGLKELDELKDALTIFVESRGHKI